MPFLSFWYNFLQDTYIIFQNSVDNFSIAHKTCSMLVWGAVPPYDFYHTISDKWSIEFVSRLPIPYCRVLVKKGLGCPFNSVEIHCTCHQLKSRSCYLFRDILSMCIEGGHWVTRTLNFFTPGYCWFKLLKN